jgi:tetratricopeptide (TPR) repeat protein
MTILRRRIISLLGVAALLLAGLVAVGLAGRFSTGSPPAAAAPSPARISRTDLAITRLQERIRLQPNHQRAYAELGDLYLQKARETADPTFYTRAEAALHRALDLRADDLQALAGLGQLALARHQFEEALTWGERARVADPYSTLPLAVTGDALVELGRYDEAFDDFREMDALRPDLSSFARLSYMRELQGDRPGAVEAMRRAVAAGGPYVENTAWARVQVGNLLFRMGEVDGAEREYRRTLFELPGFVPAQAGLARVAAARGDYATATRHLESSVVVMPLPENVILLGDLYERAGKPEEAERQYALVGAIQQLFRANGVDTDLEIALFNLDHDRELPEALDRARRAATTRPTIYANDAYAWALYKSGHYEEAMAASQQALRLGTRDGLLWFHAGMIAHRLGDRAAARDYLGRALDLNPHFSFRHGPEARRLLAELGGPAR